AEALSGTPDPNGTGGGGGSDACVPEGTGCPLVFTYPLASETSVELRGDFAPDGWDKGVPMSLEGVQWRAEITVPSGTTVHYKFLIDGKTWVQDPKNENSEPDG